MQKSFDHYWNLQVMCPDCNSADKGAAGKFTGIPQFKCNCHHYYEDPNGSRYVYHWNREQWRKHLYYKDTIPAKTNVPGKRSPTNEIVVASREVKDRRGYVKNQLGYLLVRTRFFDRMMINASEFARVGRWREAKMQLDMFLRLYCEHGGPSALEADLHPVGAADALPVHDWKMYDSRVAYLGHVYGLWTLAKLYEGGDIERWLVWLIEDHEFCQHESITLALQGSLLAVDEPDYDAILAGYMTFFAERVFSLSYELTPKLPTSESEGDGKKWRLLLPEALCGPRTLETMEELRQKNEN
ncbi:MAG: hypothetical protein OXI81_22545 [Paracoccaceae bacterium]|nr:hypothetical protein [Paracoccaceae bacterium]